MEEHRILITGGVGYVGGALTDYLIKNYPKIDFLVYDNLTFERDFRKPIKFINGDIQDTVKLKKVINDFDPTAIIWLAGRVGDGACAINPEITMEENVTTVEWLADNYNGRIIYPSSCSVYGKGDGILTEESETNPLSLYAITKLKCEEILKNKNCVMFRLGTLFGISDTYSRIRLDLVVNILSLKAQRNEPLTVFGGEQWRPLLHVRDAAKAMAEAAINHEFPIGIYNIAHKNMTIKEVAEEIKNVSNKNVEIHYSDINFEDARNYRASTEKYDNTPGAVSFNISVKDGAYEIIKLLEEGRVKNPFKNVYHNARFTKEVIENGK